jgi:predicted RNase H-like nuclease (RuvC/YqgF family)
MLEKPSGGWCIFTLGDFKFCFSYLRDTPLEIMDALIFAFKNGSMTFTLDGEDKGEAIIVSDSFETYIIQNFSNNENLDNNISVKRFEIDFIKIADMFIEDMEKYRREFSWWEMNEEPRYYDLTELKTLVREYKEKRPYYDNNN